MSVKYDDKGLKNILNVIKDLGKYSATAGYQGTDASTPVGDSREPVGNIALYQEYGTRTIPKRPFMSRAAKAYADKTFKKDSKKVLDAITNKRTDVAVTDALMDAAYNLQKEIEHQIQTSPTWAKPTKAGNHPLIGEDKSLLDNLSSAVRKDGRIVEKE